MKLLDQVRHCLCVRRYFYRTEQCYVRWVEQYIRFPRAPTAFATPPPAPPACDALGPVAAGPPPQPQSVPVGCGLRRPSASGLSWPGTTRPVSTQGWLHWQLAKTLIAAGTNP